MRNGQRATNVVAGPVLGGIWQQASHLRRWGKLGIPRAPDGALMKGLRLSTLVAACAAGAPRLAPDFSARLGALRSAGGGIPRLGRTDPASEKGVKRLLRMPLRNRRRARW